MVISPQQKRSSNQSRRGMASMEAVILAGIGVPVAVTLLYLSFRMCQYVYQATAHLVGWPYL